MLRNRESVDAILRKPWSGLSRSTVMVIWTYTIQANAIILFFILYIFVFYSQT